MRILHIVAENVLKPNGGLGVAVDDLTIETAKMGIKNTILNLDPYQPDGAVFFDKGRRFIYADCHTYTLMHEPFRYYRTLWMGMLRSMNYAVGKEDFDLIHLHDSVGFFIAEQAAHLFKCPVVMTAHLSFEAENGDAVDFMAMHDRGQERVCMGMYNIVSVSKPYGELLMQIHNPRKGIRIIPNGINRDKIAAAKPKKLKTDKPVVYMCGRLVPPKGHMEVIRAARACPEYHFVVFGNQAPKWAEVSPTIRRVIAANKFLPNYTWFKNFPVGEQFGYLKAADVALVPSMNNAPFEITGLEAMAAGVPLITTRKCGISEYADDSNSILMEPSAEGLIKALKEFKRDEGMITAGLETAKKFSWNRTAKQYIHFYKEVFVRENAKQNIAA